MGKFTFWEYTGADAGQVLIKILTGGDAPDEAEVSSNVELADEFKVGFQPNLPDEVPADPDEGGDDEEPDSD